MKEQFHFKYKGIEYDATDFAEQHPGGREVFKYMKSITTDITQYFRAFHSDQADKILRGLKVVSFYQPTKEAEEYLALYNKMQPLFAPIWSIQILLGLLLTATWFIALTTEYPIISILTFGFTIIVVPWIGHSAAHSRNKNLILYGRVVAGLLGGFAIEWWSPYHSMHHIFTNILEYDYQIKYKYPVYYYPFLFFNWRYLILSHAIQSRNKPGIILISLNYVSMLIFPQNLLYFVLAALIAGMFVTVVVVGNHQQEITFPLKPDMSFIDHQVITTRNYKYDNLFWVLIMGGMQYQTQHHLFPKIPFYRLPKCQKIIKEELERLGKTIIYGPVL